MVRAKQAKQGKPAQRPKQAQPPKQPKQARPPKQARRRSRFTVAAGGTAVTAATLAWLLASGALDPVLNGALTQAFGPKSTHRGTTLKTDRVADWQYFDNRPEWSSLRGVPQVSRPDPPVTPTRPAIAPPENPIHWQFSGPPPMPHYSLKPPGACPQQHGPGYNVEQFVAQAGTGRATVSWWDLNDPDISQYRVSAVPDYVNVGDGQITVTKKPVVSVTLAAPKACKQMTVTITGLLPGQPYHMVLQSINFNREYPGRTYAVTRGESNVFTPV